MADEPSPDEANVDASPETVIEDTGHPICAERGHCFCRRMYDTAGRTITDQIACCRCEAARAA